MNQTRVRKEYNTLVLSGGAVRGFAILGALQYYMDQGRMHHIEKVVGTSIGAIIGYLLCIGYSPIEIMVILCQTDWLKKLSHLDLLQAVQGNGAISFSVLHEILEKLTVQKIGRFLTLGQLFETYHKILVCCTYNYTRDEEEFLNPRDHPDLPCLTALRMSSNLPLLFEPFQYQGCWYFDGGFCCNFPVHHLETTDYALAVELVSPLSKDDPKKEELSPKTPEILWRLLSIPIHRMQTQRIREMDPKTFDNLSIQVDFSVALRFDLNKTEKLDLFSLGYDSAKQYDSQTPEEHVDVNNR